MMFIYIFLEDTMKKIVALFVAFAISVMAVSCGGYGMGPATETTTGTIAPPDATSVTTSPTVPDITPAEPYVDIDFSAGTITDVKGKVSLEIKTWGGASPAKVKETYVSFGGTSKLLPVLSINNTGTWAKGVFNDIANADEMNEFVKESGGFTVEVFYLDNSTTGQNRGIVCCTESIGGDARRSGWGVAETAEGSPYFITGHTGQNAYSSVEAMKASATDFIHVVAVHNADTQRNSIYVDGKLVSSKPAAGVFTAANKKEAMEGFDMGNVFYIGADPTAMESKRDKDGCDFPSNDLLVLDVKLYNKALSEAEVSAAFANAVKVFE
jgi:hypothetical protein